MTDLNPDITTRNCRHPEQDCILDDREGTLICQLCCLVINENTPQNASFVENTSKGVEGEHAELIHDWIENGNLPSFALRPALRFLTNTIFTSEQLKNTTVYSFNDLAAFALYSTLIEEDVPRSLNEIARITGVSTNKLWRLESDLGISNPLKCSAFMPKLAMQLPLSYSESRVICARADWIQERCSFSPITVLTAVVYSYMDEVRLRRQRLAITNLFHTKNADVLPSYCADLLTTQSLPPTLAVMNATKTELESQSLPSSPPPLPPMNVQLYDEVENEKIKTESAEERLRDFQMSKSQLCKLANISVSTLNRSLKCLESEDFADDYGEKERRMDEGKGKASLLNRSLGAIRTGRIPR